MKCIAALSIDFDESPIGTRSRVADDLQGKPVLTRTVERVTRSKHLKHLYLLCPNDQRDACQNLVPTELKKRVTIRPNQVNGAPFKKLVATARKWSLDGWRGGLGGTCVLDEFTRSDELALLACQQSADAVFAASPMSPLIDPALIDRMIDHADATIDEARITFAQTPPGLSGAVYRTELLVDMGKQHIPPGMVLSYKPDAPQMDLAQKSCCYSAPQPVRYARGRLIVDTHRAWQTADQYLATGQPADAESVSRWLLDRPRDSVSTLPRELEIELTTDDQLPDALLRPRGSRVPRRGPIDLAVVEKLATELAAYDDSLVVLGGFGEPLLHPQFADIVRILRTAGIYGIALRTNGLALTDEIIETLLTHKIDVVNVILDAWTPETYARVQGQDALEAVKENLTRLDARRNECQSVAPLVVPELTKSTENLDEIEPFFDGWIRRFGWAVIAGYSHFAGQLDDKSVTLMTPPTRIPCRRVFDRAIVLADGKMPLCEQDFAGRHPIGSVKSVSLSELWTGPIIREARVRHRDHHFDAIPLCARCDEWHRP